MRSGWRTAILQHTQSNFLVFLFVWNHPHGDGMSGKIFHEFLLHHLNTDEGDLTLQFADTSSEFSFPPTTEQLRGFPTSASFLLEATWDGHKPIWLFRDTHQADWAPICTSSYKSQFWTFTINNTLFNVLAACRHHKTTLTALLNSLVLISLSSHLEKSRASAFASSTAIDHRRFLPSHPLV